MSNGYISELSEICKKYPLEEKVLIVPDYRAGRQVIESLAKSGRAWSNIRLATIGSLALSVAEDSVVKQNLKIISYIETRAIMDDIFIGLAEGGKLGYFRKLAVNNGIIDALAMAVENLRMAGLESGGINLKAFVDKKKARDVRLIAAEYERVIREKRLIDNAGVIKMALGKISGGAAPKSEEGQRFIVFSRHCMLGLESEFVTKLAGAHLTVIGAGKSISADMQIFSAVGFQNEIREVLRRVLAANVPVDDVEIVHTEYETYVDVIHSLCEKLGIPVTFSDGVSGRLTTGGRATLNFLMWIKEDFSEIYLRRMLADGNIKIDSGKDSPSGLKLGHILRTSGIGWGRDRYLRIKKPEALKNICAGLLELVPVVDGAGQVDFGALCRGCAQFVKQYARVRGGQDAGFITNAGEIFETLGSLSGRRVDMEEALEKLISIVAGIRVGRASPEPGHLYVSNYKKGGLSSRGNTFVVGLDESRFPGRGTQDPILLDEERKELSAELMLSGETVKRNIYRMNAMLSELRGNVTISYSAYDVQEHRKVSPSSLILQVFRSAEGKPDADYKELFAALGKSAGYSGVSENDPAVDETGWWLNRLAGKDIPKDGAESILGIYPGIADGKKAVDSRRLDSFGKYDGKVNPAGNELDPRENGELMSSTRIEKAAKCLFAYFIERVLEVKKPDETVKDVTVWLDNLERGSMFHEVFEEYGRQRIAGKISDEPAIQEKAIKKILAETVEKYKENIPPPSEVIFKNEYVQLERDVKVFLRLDRELGTKTIICEMAFGSGKEPPVEISLGNGKSIKLRGFVDRIDSAGEHSYHVWDYKSGSAYQYEQEDYIKGGEQLQHVLYAEAVEKCLRRSDHDKNAKVTASGYILTSEKGTRDGKGGIFKRDPSKKEIWTGALNKLFDLIGKGAFFASDQDVCLFCDYKSVCGGQLDKKRAAVMKDPLLDAWRELKKYE